MRRINICLVLVIHCLVNTPAAIADQNARLDELFDLSERMGNLYPIAFYTEHAVMDPDADWFPSRFAGQSFRLEDGENFLARSIVYRPRAMGEGLGASLVLTRQLPRPDISDIEFARLFEDIVQSSLAGYCSEIVLWRFEHEQVAGNTQSGVEVHCSTASNESAPNAIASLEVTIVRFAFVGESTFTLLRSWQGNQSEWDAYLHANPNYFSDWNADLDQISVCDLSDFDMPCPALGIGTPDSSILPDSLRNTVLEAADADSISSADQILGVLSIEPVFSPEGNEPAHMEILPQEETYWTNSLVSDSLSRTLTSVASEGRSGYLIAAYSSPSPTSPRQIVSDRALVANFMIQVYLSTYQLEYRRMTREHDTLRFSLDIEIADNR